MIERPIYWFRYLRTQILSYNNKILNVYLSRDLRFSISVCFASSRSSSWVISGSSSRRDFWFLLCLASASARRRASSTALLFAWVDFLFDFLSQMPDVSSESPPPRLSSSKRALFALGPRGVVDFVAVIIPDVYLSTYSWRMWKRETEYLYGFSEYSLYLLDLYKPS